ncbi:MAG: MaoC family dehydratase [Rhizobiaceae bacterium]
MSVGDRIQSGSLQVTAEIVDAFADMTGDRFEIHMDDAAARKHGFPKRVAHGLLVLSLVDGLKNQCDAQFKAIASLGWDWTFSRPVFVGDQISTTISVIDMRTTSKTDRGIVTLEFDVTNQHGETVQRGTNKLMVYR